ncbi:MAG: response regulator transcription factor [Methylococcaceae bacterium]|nr:MAG: response regulator transcription factor [Methylococcaceae bacterium]
MTESVRRAVTADERKFAQRCARGRVVVIDDDAEILSALATLLDFEGYACETYPSAPAYLQALSDDRPCFPGPCCVLCDVKMPELDGLELQQRLAALEHAPLLLMSGASGALEAVSAFRAGALDFLIKPIDADVLLQAVVKALAVSLERQRARGRRHDLVARMAALTGKERAVARLAARGRLNREIAVELDIALRTVKLHRQRAMEKLGANSVVDLARIADEGGL